MNCREVEMVLEQEGLLLLPAPAHEHLAACNVCRDLVDDFSSIVSAARELPAEVEPPARLWISLRAQLESEGVIRGVSAAEKGSWLESLSALFLSRAFATAAIGLLLVAAAYLQVRQKNEVAQNVKETAPVREAYDASFAETASYLNQQESEVAKLVPAGAVVAPVASSLRENLQILNSFIADCEQHVKENPRDALAREYLNTAYQQKAELLAAIMDRSRGVN